MQYSQLKKRIANFDDKPFTDHTYAIYNAFGVIAIVYADHEQDAIDAAVDSGKLESELVSAEDQAEHEANGWTDSFMYAGNASEAIWIEHLGITLIK